MASEMFDPVTKRWSIRAVLVLASAAAIGFLLYATVWAARLPESNCESKAVTESWAPDHAYKATILEKSCNAGETIFYSVRLDAAPTPTNRGWFLPELELENDQYPAHAPVMRWSAPRALDVEVPTRTLTGEMSQSVGSDITIRRTYVAREPGARPNFN